MEENYNAMKTAGVVGTGVAAGLLSIIFGCANTQQYTPQPVQQQGQAQAQETTVKQAEETPGQLLATIKYNLERLCADGTVNINNNGNNEYQSIFALVKKYKEIDTTKLNETDKKIYEAVGTELAGVMNKVMTSEKLHCNIIVAYDAGSGGLVVRGAEQELKLPDKASQILKEFNIDQQRALDKASYGGFTSLREYAKNGKVSFDAIYGHHERVPVTPEMKKVLHEIAKTRGHGQGDRLGIGEGDRTLTARELELLTDGKYEQGVNGEVQHMAVGVVVDGDTVVDEEKAKKAKEAAQQQALAPQPVAPTQPAPQPTAQTPTTQPTQPQTGGQTPSARLLGSQ